MAKVRPQNGTNAVFTPNGLSEATIISSYTAIDGDALFKMTSNIPGPNTYNGISINMGIISNKNEQWSPVTKNQTEIVFEGFTTNNFNVRHMTIDLPCMFYLAENLWGGSIVGGGGGADYNARKEPPDFLVDADYRKYAAGYQGSLMKSNWNYYSVPYGAISRLINKIYFKIGGLVDLTNTYEQYGIGLSITSQDHMTGLNTTEDMQKNMMGDPFSYRCIGNVDNQTYRQAKMRSGHPSNPNGTTQGAPTGYKFQPSKFLDNFNCLLMTEPVYENRQGETQTGYNTAAYMARNKGLWATRMRIPLSMLIPVLQSDMMFGPGIKIQIKLELPMWNFATQPLPLDLSAAGYAVWKNYGNFNCLAKPAVIDSFTVQTVDPTAVGGTAANPIATSWNSNVYYNITQTDNPAKEIKMLSSNLGDHSTGLFGTIDISRTPLIEIVYYVLIPEIANDLMQIRVYQPMVLNNESLTIFYDMLLQKGTRTIRVAVQPNANLPQEMFIGFVNLSNPVVVARNDINYSIATAGILVKSQYDQQTGGFNNPMFVFPDDPLPFLVKRLQIDYGNTPNIDFNRNLYETSNTYIKTINKLQLYTPSQATTMLGMMPLTNFQNEVMNKSYLNRTLNSSQSLPYSDFKSAPEIGAQMPEISTWFRTILVPDSVQRGGSAADNSSHNINIMIDLDTESPYWSALQAMITTDTRVVVARKTLSQFLVSANGDATRVDWPAMLIEGTKPGSTQRVTGNPTNGAFQ